MMKYAPGSRALERPSPVWLHCLAAVVLVSGASGGCRRLPLGGQFPQPVPPQEEVLPVEECEESETDCGVPLRDMRLSEPCPTGQCDPEGNGRGIYKVEGSTHCFLDEGRERFCPEAFINNPPGLEEAFPSVTLRGRDLLRNNTPYEARVSARVEAPGGPAVDMWLLGVRAERSGFAATVCPVNADCHSLGNRTTFTGAALRQLTLRLSIDALVEQPSTAVHYALKVTPRDTAGDTVVQKFDVRHAELDDHGQPRQWENHCDASGVIGPGSDAAGFLPRWDVNGLNAAVTREASHLTMGCESGAIITCQDWGYMPWDPATGNENARRLYVFGSCLQAKRAAYFVGWGDLASYTRNGTRIFKRDQYGHGRGAANGRPEDLPWLEAIWSPRGVVCLNPESRRLRRSVSLPSVPQVPVCGSPPAWSRKGKLATSPVELE